MAINATKMAASKVRPLSSAVPNTYQGKDAKTRAEQAMFRLNQFTVLTLTGPASPKRQCRHPSTALKIEILVTKRVQMTSAAWLVSRQKVIESTRAMTTLARPLCTMGCNTACNCRPRKAACWALDPKGLLQHSNRACIHHRRPAGGAGSSESMAGSVVGMVLLKPCRSVLTQA